MTSHGGAPPVSRRSILAASLAGLGAAASTSVMAQSTVPKRQNVVSPTGALEILRAGNRRYVEGTTKRHDFAHERAALQSGQNPFAAILSCADSRIAPEYAFDSARGDLFVVRVAGNFLSEDGLASLEYAVTVLATPLILVLGHEACGAVSAAIKSITQGDVLPGHLPSIVEALRPAVDESKSTPDILAQTTQANVRLTAEKIARSSQIIADIVEQGRVAVRGGLYRLGTGQVDFF